VYYQHSSPTKSKIQQLLGGKLTLSQLKAGQPVGGNTQVQHCIGYVKSCTAVRKSCKVEEIIEI